MIKNITTEELKGISVTDGLVLQGCGGPAEDWLNGINDMLTEVGILRNGEAFKDIYVFDRNGITNILYPFNEMNPDNLDMGKLAMWRLQHHSTFAGTWLSDYRVNQLGMSNDEMEKTVTQLEADTPPIVAVGENQSPYSDESHESYADTENFAPTHPIQVYIENVHDESIGGFTIPLPAKLDELQGFLEASEITGWQDAEILEVLSDIKGLGELVTEIIKKTMSPEMLDELNYLAARLEGMGNDEHEAFTSAIEAKRHCSTVAELINLTENLDCFDLQPAFNAEQYGEFLLEVANDNTAAVFDKLEHSQNSDERDLAKHILLLEAYIDKAAYGCSVALEEKGVFTEKGYLTESGEFNEVYRSSIDIPDEYRIFTKPGEVYQSPMKLDGEDIAETLAKIKAVCCENMTGTAELLRTISQGQDRDYLLMVNKDRVFVTPAIEAYKNGELTEKTIHHWAQMPDTSFFALRVMERGESNGRGMTGDFIELNTTALLANIERHTVMPDRIDAIKHGGFGRSYDLDAWAEVSQSQRGELESYTSHFPDSDLAHAVRRYASFMGANEMSSEAVSMDTFLLTMNTAYMATAENPQPDMLRITNEAAKQILARGDTDVFKLTPTGTEKLAPIEAAKPTSFTAHRELAIRREDISGLDKWAKGAVKGLQRQNERDERKKTHGEEH